MIAFWIYLTLLVFAPLAFGTTEQWSIATVEIAAGAVASIAFVTFWVKRERFVVVPGATPLFLLLLFISLQLVPLPPGIVHFIAPGNYDAYAPLFAVNGEQWIPLTINQKNTLLELLRVGSYSLVYVVTIQLLNMHVALRRTLGVVIWLAAGIAFFSIIQRLSAPDTLFWLRVKPDGTSPFGPWVNPNQYAGFMEMLAPLAISLFLFYKPRLSGRDGFRQKIVAFFSMPGGNLHMLFGLAAVVITMSVFVSLCRGGILTISVSLLIFMLLYNARIPQQGRGAVLLITCCILVTVSWFGWDTVIAEFDNSVSPDGQLSDGRFDLWQDTMQLIKDFFFFGSGFGTYIDIYPSYKTIPGNSIFDHAHNDYLELMTDGGIIGFSLAAWFVLTVIRHGWSMIRARRDQYASLLGIGALTGVVAVLLHSFTDFNMHNGAVGLYFFFLCGLLVAAVNSRFSGYESRSLLKVQSQKNISYYAVAATLYMAIVTTVQYRTLAANAAFTPVKDIYVSKNLREDKKQELASGVTRAEKLDPLDRRYSGKMASLAWYDGNIEQARRKYIETVRKNPMTGDALQWLGLMTEDEETAKMLIEKGYRRALNRDDLAMTYVGFLLYKNDRHTAIEIIAEEIGQRTALIRKWAPFMTSYHFTPDEVRGTLPKTPLAWITYGDYLQKMGDFDGAEYYRANALTFIDQDKEIQPGWFQQLIQFYHATGQPEKAQLALREAVDKLPNHAPFRVQLGDHFRSAGIIFKAEEEYKRALMLDPANVGAKKGLRKMGLLDAY